MPFVLAQSGFGEDWPLLFTQVFLGVVGVESKHSEVPDVQDAAESLKDEIEFEVEAHSRAKVQHVVPEGVHDFQR